MSTSSLSRVLLGLRWDWKQLGPEQRTGVILAATLKDARLTRIPRPSQRELKQMTDILRRAVEDEPSGSEPAQNGLGTLLMLSSRASSGVRRQLATTAVQLLDKNDLLIAGEPLTWGLSILQRSGSASHESEVFRVSCRLLASPTVDSTNVRSVSNTLSRISLAAFDTADLVGTIIPSLYARFRHDPEVVESLLALLTSIEGQSSEMLKWRISLENLGLPRATQTAIEMMSIARMSIPRQDYSQVAMFVLSQDKVLSSLPNADDLLRRWIAAGIPFDLAVNAEMSQRLIDRGDITLIRQILRNCSSTDKISLLKQIMLWSGQNEWRAIALAPLIEAELASEVEIDVAALEELVGFARNMDSVPSSLAEALKRGILDSGRTIVLPLSVLDFLEQRIIQGDDFLDLTLRDQLGRELEDFRVVNAMRSMHYPLESASSRALDRQRASFLSRVYQHTLSDPTLLSKAKAMLDTLDFTKVPVQAEATITDALNQLTSGPRPGLIAREMTSSELRATEWGLFCIDKNKASLKHLKHKIQMSDARDVYVRARLALDHPSRMNMSMPAAVESVHAVFRSVDEGDADEFQLNLEWMLADSTLGWDTPSAALHAPAIAGLCKTGVKFSNVGVARKMSEYMNRKVLERASPSGMETPPSLADLTKEHALFVIAKACQFLQGDVVEFDEGCAERADALMEWFCSGEQSNLFGSICNAVEASTRDQNASLVQVGLSAIRDCLVMEYLHPDVVKKPLYESMRKRLANVIVATAEKFPMDEGYFPVLLAGLSACASFQASEPNALWTDHGTRIPLLAAQQLKRRAREDAAAPVSLPMAQPDFNDASDDDDILRHLFADYDHDPSEPSEISSTVVPWIIHCGLVASSFKTAPTTNTPTLPNIRQQPRRDILSMTSKNNIGNALLTFLSLDIVRDHPDKTLVPCLNALASFAGRFTNEWTRVDTKILVKTLRLAQSDKRIAAASLGILREYARRPVLGNFRPGTGKKGATTTAQSSSGSSNNKQRRLSATVAKTHPIVDRTIDVVLSAFPPSDEAPQPGSPTLGASKSKISLGVDPSVALNGFRTISGLLENLPDVGEYQLRLYEKGFVKTCSSALVWFLATEEGREDVAEAAALALQNMFAFQPRVTREVCRNYVTLAKAENARVPTSPWDIDLTKPHEPVQLLTALIFSGLGKDHTKLATAAIGAYFALVQADPEASLEVTKISRTHFPILPALIKIREVHSGEPVLRETAEALLEFLRKQYFYSQNK